MHSISSSSTAANETSMGPQSDFHVYTVPIVGGVVALVAVVVAIVTGVVMVTYLVLRYKRGGKVVWVGFKWFVECH